MTGIDDDYRLALGGLVMEVSILDSKVTELVAALSKMDLADALILVHPQQPTNKLDGLRALFRRLYPAEDDPRYRPVREVLDRVKAVTEFRNSVVHALWYVDEEGTPHAVRFQARGEFKRSIQPAPVEKIRECTLEAKDLAGSLGDLAKAYRAWHPM
jgi:hypothetical protein